MYHLFFNVHNKLQISRTGFNLKLNKSQSLRNVRNYRPVESNYFAVHIALKIKKPLNAAFELGVCWDVLAPICIHYIQTLDYLHPSSDNKLTLEEICKITLELPYPSHFSRTAQQTCWRVSYLQISL